MSVAPNVDNMIGRYALPSDRSVVASTSTKPAVQAPTLISTFIRTASVGLLPEVRESQEKGCWRRNA